MFLKGGSTETAGADAGFEFDEKAGDAEIDVDNI